MKSHFINKKAFTLIELLIAVAISALLMISVTIFISAAIKNNSHNQKILSNQYAISPFEYKMLEEMELISGSGIINSGTGIGSFDDFIFFKKDSGNPISFIGLKTFTGFCDNAGPTATQSGTIKRMIIRDMNVPASHLTATNFRINKSDNSIEDIASGKRIIGTGIGGDDLDYDNPTSTELNGPNALAESSGMLYIADTLNSRILAYDKTNKKIKKIAGNEDGISFPGDLILQGGALYIANTGKGEVLELKDGYGNGSTLDATFRLTKNINFDNIVFAFDGISNISGPSTTGDFTFSSIGKSAGDSISTGSALKYSFTGGLKTLNSSSDNTIKIDNISLVPANPGSYSANISFFSGSSKIYSLYVPYFLKGDGSIFGDYGNHIVKISKGSEFLSNLTSSTIFDDKITDWQGLLDQGYDETLSDAPIKDFSYSQSGGLLTIKYDYYKFYDCISGNSIIKEKIFKKKIY